MAEPFFKTLKRELAEGRSHGTRGEAKRDIFKRIEPYYNGVRMHSTLGYMSPAEYERQYAWGSLKESPLHPSRSKSPDPKRSRISAAVPYPPRATE